MAPYARNGVSHLSRQRISPRCPRGLDATESDVAGGVVGSACLAAGIVGYLIAFGSGQLFREGLFQFMNRGGDRR